MKPTHKVTGVLHKTRRMRSSTNGNPRFEVQIDGNLYRTKPDSDFAYDVLNLLGKLVEVTVKEYHGWPTIMYGFEALENMMDKKPDTPIVAAGNKPEDNTPVTSPEAVFQRLRREETTENEYAFLLGFYERLVVEPDKRQVMPRNVDWQVAYDNGRAMAEAVHNNLTGQE